LGIYNMYLGGDFVGTRLNRLYKEQLKEYEILKELEMIFKDFAENRKNKEPFGDFVWRKGYVNEDVPLNI
ncbi:MAG: sulfite reductase, partial [Bacteroidota bacterium]